MAIHNDIGYYGENLACQLLEKKGYKILVRNWRFKKMEIDIVAQNDEFVVIVEVKTRTSTFADKEPYEYVDKAKLRHIGIAGKAFYHWYHFTNHLLRFDIISIVLDKYDTQRVRSIEHLEDIRMA